MDGGPLPASLPWRVPSLGLALSSGFWAREPHVPVGLFLSSLVSGLHRRPQVFRMNLCLVHWCTHSACLVALSRCLVDEST